VARGLYTKYSPDNLKKEIIMKGTRSRQAAPRAPRRGWAIGPGGMISHGVIAAGETELTPAQARALSPNMITQTAELHEQTQEIMYLAT